MHPSFFLITFALCVTITLNPTLIFSLPVLSPGTFGLSCLDRLISFVLFQTPLFPLFLSGDQSQTQGKLKRSGTSAFTPDAGPFGRNGIEDFLKIVLAIHLMFGISSFILLLARSQLCIFFVILLNGYFVIWIASRSSGEASLIFCNLFL